MALNLSRNTKVFVSSVNGVGPTGGVKTCHVSTAGSGYAVGDIVTLTNVGSSNGVDFKCNSSIYYWRRLNGPSSNSKYS